MRSRRSRVLAVGLAVTSLAVVWGCRTPFVRSISEQELLNRHQDFLRAYQSDLDAMTAKANARIEVEYRSALGSPSGERQSYDVLILSGGGAFGAFGAGFLDGWGQVTESEFVRPRFDSVSGISTGSLIAPFAFLGTQEAYRTIVELYENPQRDWVRKRWITRYLPRNVSLFDVSELHAKIRSAITPDLIRAIAAGAAERRLLLVGAANVDYGLMRVWDLAQTALESPSDEAIERITSILLASTAIPGAFPPIVIDDLLYVDGGASMQVVGGTDDRNWAYVPDGPLAVAGDGPPIRIRIWIVVNQKLLPEPKVVRPRWTSVGTRSVSTLLRTSTLQSIQDAETFVRLIDHRPDFDAEMRYVAIPQDYPIPKTDYRFAAAKMSKLVALGRRMGADTASWRTGALRPGAPFDLQ